MVPVAEAHDDPQQGPGALEYGWARGARRGWDSCRRCRRMAATCSARLRDRPYRLLDTFYVTNFMDYRFLQVFLSDARHSGVVRPRRQDCDSRCRARTIPRCVQTDGVWSRDGKYIVFARAEAKAPREKGQGPAIRANDPNETQIQYDLYRIPFNEGKGGTPERIVGASQNGMSNTFPDDLAGRALDCVCRVPQRPADAAGQPALYCPIRGRRGAAHARQPAS